MFVTERRPKRYAVLKIKYFISFDVFRLITNEKSKTRRPITVIILSILIILSLVPLSLQFFERDPLEVAFKYPGPNRPLVQDTPTYIALTATIFLAQALLFIGCVLAGIGILARQRLAWFAALGLVVSIIIIHILAAVVLADNSNGRYASIAISIGAIYLLFRIDVRDYLRPVKSK